MTLKEARKLSKLFPDRYHIKAKFLSGNDEKIALFNFALFEKKDYGFWEVIYNNYPLGISNDAVNGIGNWLYIENIEKY